MSSDKKFFVLDDQNEISHISLKLLRSLPLEHVIAICVDESPVKALRLARKTNSKIIVTDEALIHEEFKLNDQYRQIERKIEELKALEARVSGKEQSLLEKERELERKARALELWENRLKELEKKLDERDVSITRLLHAGSAPEEELDVRGEPGELEAEDYSGLFAHAEDLRALTPEKFTRPALTAGDGEERDYTVILNEISADVERRCLVTEGYSHVIDKDDLRLHFKFNLDISHYFHGLELEDIHQRILAVVPMYFKDKFLRSYRRLFKKEELSPTRQLIGYNVGKWWFSYTINGQNFKRSIDRI